SRACLICGTQKPRDRFVSTACGHVVCGFCAEGAKECPLCLKPTKMVHLFEDQHTRECGVCLCESPVIRRVIRSCGHLLYSACLIKIWMDACRSERQFVCPFCRADCNPAIVLQEDEEKEKNKTKIRPKSA
ncbi:hypothetical protein PENTCL1PPCAC_18776, partial [Pristionchus entomophagus]